MGCGFHSYLTVCINRGICSMSHWIGHSHANQASHLRRGMGKMGWHPGILVNTGKRGHECLLLEKTAAIMWVSCHAWTIWNKCFTVDNRQASGGVGRENWNLMACKASLFLHYFLSLLGSSSNDPVYWTHRRDISFIAHTLLQKSVTNFPRKDARILLFVFLNLCHNIWSSNFRLAASNNTWFDRARLIVPVVMQKKKGPSL